jgi:hypothetical protein
MFRSRARFFGRRLLLLRQLCYLSRGRLSSIPSFAVAIAGGIFDTAVVVGVADVIIAMAVWVRADLSTNEVECGKRTQVGSFVGDVVTEEKQWGGPSRRLGSLHV